MSLADKMNDFHRLYFLSKAAPGGIKVRFPTIWIFLTKEQIQGSITDRSQKKDPQRSPVLISFESLVYNDLVAEDPGWVP